MRLINSGLQYCEKSGFAEVRTMIRPGFLLSLSIETAQFVLGSGVSELDDLILNTLGALLGHLGTALFLHLFHRRNRHNGPADTNRDL